MKTSERIKQQAKVLDEVLRKLYTDAWEAECVEALEVVQKHDPGVTHAVIWNNFGSSGCYSVFTMCDGQVLPHHHRVEDGSLKDALATLENIAQGGLRYGMGHFLLDSRGLSLCEHPPEELVMAEESAMAGLR